MKKALLAIASIAILFVLTCCKPTKENQYLSTDEVKDAITATQTERFISHEKCEELKAMYVANGGSAEDFDSDLLDIVANIESDENWTIVIKTQDVKPVVSVIYLDNTSSMKGFFERGKGASSDVKDFVNVFDNLRKNTDDNVVSYYIDQSGYVETTLGEMTTKIGDKNMKSRDAYLMDVFLDSIVTRTNADSVNSVMTYFVTDAIMSGTSQDLKNNPNYNIEHASTLSTNIAAKLKKLKDKQYGVALLRFNALYDGPYFNYHNGIENIKAPRPFFLMVIGPSKELINLEKKVRDNKIFGEPDPDIFVAATKDSDGHAGMPTLSIYVPNGECEIDDEDVNKFEVKSKSENPQIEINFDLSTLPEYMRDEETAKKALEIKLDDKTLDMSNAKLNGNTLTLKTNLIGYNDEYKLSVQVQNVLPVWIEKCNSANDENVMAQLGKTFNLNHLVTGLINGIYSAPGGIYINEKENIYTITKD